ncbi:signal transduction histidine kinase [Geodermatophilus tzadiensis]|uniref:histidine kinase n=1 Tax=Geodermatophilus tzadiensis TaxID=1137988 RepID=A0A2T0TQS0_9ACTN|nr:histidine kinase [Geodermatophilus tzadiensis]PRY47981.1 signal transduction histidine kinase [Geodermatophilus tzadiensis]
MAPTPTAARPHPPGRWAGTRIDAWLAGGLGVLAVLHVLLLPAGPAYAPVDEGRFLLAVLGPLALLWRQTAPVVAQAGASATVVVNAAAGYPIGFLDWPAWIALFSCFDVGGRRVRAAATVVAALGIAGYVVFDRGAPTGQLPGIVLHFLVAVVVGELSSRRTRAVVAEARLVAESREQALAAERLLLQERNRLARELHDSLGHTVNVMVLQAGVGRRVFADNPAFAQEALGSVETVGRAALEELNRVLAVLQPDDPRSAEPFAPTVADLGQLVDRIRSTGRQVDLRTTDVELPAPTARAVYRIAQEALTNAVKHTPAGRIRVAVDRRGSEVVLEVVNDCAPVAQPSSGHGLVNMRERARLEGGELEAGPVQGGFRVHAVLPVAAGVPS